MQVHKQQVRQKKEGYVLLVTLAFTIVLLIVLASMMGWVTTNSSVTRRNSQFVSSEYAAEAATERILGQMSYDWVNNGILGSNTVYAVLIPTNTSDWPIQYVFSDTNGVKNRVSVSVGQQSWVTLSAPYSGLMANITPCTVTATATPVDQLYDVPATVSQNFDATSIPIFQYLIFYNLNLEIDAGAQLDVNGPVFSNAGLWTGSDVVTFSNIVWAVSQTVVNGPNDPFITYTGTGPSIYAMKGQPVSGVNHVTMPIAGTNNDPAVVEGILQWPPWPYSLGSALAQSGNGQVYMANQADLIISNSISGTNSSVPTGTNFFVYYQDTLQVTNTNPNNFCPHVKWVPNDFYIITNCGTTNSNLGHQLVTSPPNTNYVPAVQWTNSSGHVMRVWYAGYSFLTNVVFYDWREGWNSSTPKTVQAVQFDVGRFNCWLATNTVNGGITFNTACQNDKNHSIGGVYIYNSVPLSTTVLPAVRVVDGSQLYDNYGLSFATPMPIYVKGNFNVTDGSGISDAGTISTAHSRPASFLADAITILSANWNDSTTKMPTPSETTIHAACLEGIVPSDPNLGTPSDDSQYSGGVENFLRLLENWSGVDLYYNGSIVVMFPSDYATNRWRETGNYYNAPVRDWSFDTNFTVQTKLPPMTPKLQTTIRNSWAGS